MPQTTIAGRTLDVDHEGYLTDFEQWDAELAHELATFAGIDELTDEHFHVIEFLRSDFQTTGTTPGIARLASVGGFEVPRLHELFPGKPSKKMAYVAGLPPVNTCV